MRKLKVYLGWDPKERAAYDVARASIITRTDPKQVSIAPIELDELRKQGLFTRPVLVKDGQLWCPISQAPMATEFAISRFAIPLIQKRGWALFCDCDVLATTDVLNIMAWAKPEFAVSVVKHAYQPTETVKMVDKPQTSYSRKNWSSVVLWNCEHPAHAKLTKQVLNEWPGRDLHAFKWLEDNEIGELPRDWNYLVGVYPDADPAPGLLHYTLGGPWLEGWKGGPLDGLWLAEQRKCGVPIKHPSEPAH